MKKSIVSLIVILLFSQMSSKGQIINQVGYYDVQGIYCLTSNSNYMFLGDGSIVDISNPSNPTLKSKFDIKTIFGTAILLEGNYVYYGAGISPNLIVVDVTDPADPVEKSSRVFDKSMNGLWAIAKKNEIVYAVTNDGGIYSIDVSDKKKLVTLDSVLIDDGYSGGIAIRDNYAYVAHSDGIKILDITDPNHINVTSMPGRHYIAVAIQNTTAIFGTADGSMEAFDITNPLSPKRLYSVPVANNIWDVKMNKDLVFMAADSMGLFITKRMNNTAVKIGNFKNTGNGLAYSVALQEDLIMLTGFDKGVALLKYDSIATVVNKEIKNENIYLFPNPANSAVEFVKDDGCYGELQISTISGQCVLKEQCTANKTQIDISGLSKGVYMITYQSDRVNWQQKLIKTE